MTSLPKARVVVAPNSVVNVHVSGETLYNLGAINELRSTILGKLGCLTCCSGFLINFKLEEGELNIGA